MAYIPVSGVVELELRFEIGGQHVEMTFHVGITGGIDGAVISNLISVLFDWWDDTLSTIVSTDLFVTGAKGTDLTTSSSPTVELTYAGAVPHGTNGSGLPNNVALAVTKATDNRGRSYRGRNYLVGIPESAMNTPVALDASYITSILSVWDVLHTALAIEDAIPVVVSKFHNGVPRAEGVATPITSIRANADVDSQRRRLAGRGA